MIYLNPTTMSANPNASSETLSASQQQLLKSVQQLQDAQKDLVNKYTTASDPTERKKIADEMNKNELLRTNLLSSAGNIAQVQTQQVVNKRDAAKELAILVELAEQELKDVRDRLDAVQSNRSGKERMIELNTYYGKRFMAQAGVMKIFIYMCIPVLVLAVLANMELLPNYIAGFMIIASIVVGIVYLYSAVHDINRRDKMNFDEYTWEFDPSRVGSVINPDDGKKKHKSDSNAVGCFDGDCCNGVTTTWDPASKSCVVQDAQGGGSAVKGANTKKSDAGASASEPALLGDLNSPL